MHTSLWGANIIGEDIDHHILTQFLNQIVLTHPQVHTVVIGPEPDNLRAIKSYKKVGFHHIKTIQIPDKPQPTYLMELKPKTS